jgi:aspartyl aminopeptidase
VKSLVADAASVSEDDITYVDAYLGDAAKPAILGDNFLSASRLDNLVSYFASVLELCAKDRPAKSWRMIASFDSEEIGSQTWNGGRSTLISSVLNRLLEQEADVPPSEAYARFANKSFVASIDAAHGKHPLFPNSLEPRNAPVLNGGVAVKVSAAGHYAMAPELLGQVVGALDANDLPYQYFSYRNDIGGGSSLGPLLSTSLGMKTIDFGVPLLSMHSIREMAGVDDIHTLMQMISKVVWAD